MLLDWNSQVAKWQNNWLFKKSLCSTCADSLALSAFTPILQKLIGISCWAHSSKPAVAGLLVWTYDRKMDGHRFVLNHASRTIRAVPTVHFLWEATRSTSIVRMSCTFFLLFSTKHSRLWERVRDVLYRRGGPGPRIAPRNFLVKILMRLGKKMCSSTFTKNANTSPITSPLQLRTR